MKQENKTKLINYLICFGVAAAITLIVFAIKGFFTDSPGVNIQILADGFTVSGVLMTLFAGLMFVSGEGALLGVGFIMRSVLLFFIPAGRLKHETYAKYRERKLGKLKKASDHSVLFTGLAFLLIGIIFTAIWYFNFYTPPIA